MVLKGHHLPQGSMMQDHSPECIRRSEEMRRAVVDDSASGSKTSPLVKASSRRQGASLRQLEALHKSSETSTHLRIPDKKRIKLLHDHPSDGVHPISRTMKKGPNLGEDDGVTGGTNLIELSDSDEFPEPCELVRASIRNAGEADESLVSRASDYSDSDMDALVRGAHLDGITSIGIDTANNKAFRRPDPFSVPLSAKDTKKRAAMSL
ncbi:hypothetical protein BJV77DRAFT_44723 [Russula vinacea]|nr:hypothetical protein BJV77DRAFT_44723 [Russula vinacea]